MTLDRLVTSDFIASLRLGESLERAVSSELTLVFFALTGAAFFLFAALLVRAGRVRERVDRMVGNYADHLRLNSERRLRIPTAQGERDAVGGLLRACLEEFDARLVEHAEGRSRGLSGANVLDSERIIHEVDLLGFVPYEIVRLGPAVLTALGLLGTFFGITNGLGAIGDVGVQGSDAILPIVSDVVKGLATAFWTSIVGVISGVVIMWWSRTTEHKLDITVEQAIERLDRLFAIVTPEQLASFELDRLDEQTEQLRSLTATSHAGATALNSIDGRLERAVTATETLVQHMRRLTEDSEESRSLLQQLIDDLGKTFTAAFENTMTPQLERMVVAIREQVSQVGATGSDSARQFAQEMVSAVSKDLRETFSSMATSVSGFTSGFEQMIGRVEQSVASQASVVQAGLDATRVAQEAAATASAQIERVQGVVTDTGGVVASIASLGTEFRELVSGVERAGSTYQAAAADLGGFSTQFAEEARRLGQTVAGLGAVVSDATGRLDRTLGKIDTRLDAERELAERYAKVGSDFLQVLQRATPTMEHLKESARSLAQVSQSFQAMVATLESAPQRVEEATEALSNSATQLQGAADAVATVNESMDGWRDEATTAINEFHIGLTTSVKESLALYDAALSHAVSSLSAAFDDLEELLGELQERQGMKTPSATE